MTRHTLFSGKSKENIKPAEFTQRALKVEQFLWLQICSSIPREIFCLFLPENLYCNISLGSR